MRKTNEQFIKDANKIHNNKYDYSKAEYKNNKTKLCIICHKHGEFWQTPHAHLQGQGCPKCAKHIWDTKKFIEVSNEVHGGKYDYASSVFYNMKEKITIKCPLHGEFLQRPDAHLQGQGCPKCGNERVSLLKRDDCQTFVNKAKKIHFNKYEYSNVIYENNREKVCIICPEHGEFWQIPYNHLKGKGCPICGQIISKAEDEILELLKTLECQQHNRILLKGREIDVYVRGLKIGIEYNGLLWHSEEFGKDSHYHLDKLNECNKQGIGLIQIFEDEWVNHREICESKLKQICGLNNNPKIYARKCEVREIDKQEAYDFLEKNHIQGKTGFTVGLGTYYEGKLVGVMTFKREKDGYWDLNRFASDINYQCIGIGGKLFKYFTRNYEFIEIKSFADRRWTINPSDNLYIKLGFSFDSYVPPSYWYYNPSINKYRRFHKFGFRKQPLHKKYGLPLEMTELEMTKALGYTRIWDCGLIKYVYKNDE